MSVLWLWVGSTLAWPCHLANLCPSDSDSVNQSVIGTLKQGQSKVFKCLEWFPSMATLSVTVWSWAWRTRSSQLQQIQGMWLHGIYDIHLGNQKMSKPQAQEMDWRRECFPPQCEDWSLHPDNPCKRLGEHGSPPVIQCSGGRDREPCWFARLVRSGYIETCVLVCIVESDLNLWHVHMWWLMCE